MRVESADRPNTINTYRSNKHHTKGLLRILVICFTSVDFSPVDIGTLPHTIFIYKIQIPIYPLTHPSLHLKYYETLKFGIVVPLIVKMCNNKRFSNIHNSKRLTRN